MIQKNYYDKLKNIKVLALDIDGTLTDGSMYYAENGLISKRFYAPDGLGLMLLKSNGIKTVFLTSENSNIIDLRAKRLNIDYVVSNTREKSKDIDKISEFFNVSLSEIGFIGDDVNDFYALKKVGFSACPKDGQQSIKEIVDYICDKKGGRGAVREICDLLLLSQKKNLIIPENW